MGERATEETITMPAAAENPPRKTSRASQGCPLVKGRVRAKYAAPVEFPWK